MKTLSFLIGTALILGSAATLRAQGCCPPSGATGHARHGQTTVSIAGCETIDSGADHSAHQHSHH